MSLQFGILAGAFVFGILGFAFSAICTISNRKCKNMLEVLAQNIEEIDSDLAESRELLEDAKLRASDQARRVAWLEARIRKPEKVKKEVSNQEVFVPKLKEMNMTERRHRVLTLASRGQDAETISSTLGMLPGEVELIMKIGRGVADYA